MPWWYGPQETVAGTCHIFVNTVSLRPCPRTGPPQRAGLRQEMTWRREPPTSTPGAGHPDFRTGWHPHATPARAPDATRPGSVTPTRVSRRDGGGAPARSDPEPGLEAV